MKHDSVAPLRSISPIRLTFSAISIVFSIVLALAAFGAPLGTSWTYQGQLRRSGAAYTGACNFQFSLWDAASAGTQQAGMPPINGVNVVNGLFTVQIDFGPNLIIGSALWLATSVQCSGDGGFTQLDPRQLLTATPYAFTLRPGAIIDDLESAVSTPVLAVNSFSANGSAVKGFRFGASGYGVYGLAGGVNAAGVFGENSLGTGIWGKNTGNGGIGVYGESFSSGRGVSGVAAGANSAGVYGENTSGAAIWGHSGGVGSAIFGENTSTGFAGRFVGPVDITGQLAALNTSGTGSGIQGSGAIGVFGQTNSGNGSGVAGSATLANSAGVFGSNRDSAAIWGRSTGVGSAIFGENLSTGFAGRFIGPVSIQGTLTKSAGTFQIDHPLDPAHKFLSHSFVESPEMMNIYNGNVTTDATGSATVTLPAYFAALNRDYRYQLTVLGQFAQAIVSRKIIADNTFAIRTDKPGVEVSWLVTGVRQDAYAKEHPIVVEQAKSAEEDGKYLYPAGFGAGEEKRIGHLHGPALGDGAQNASGAGPSGQASK